MSRVFVTGATGFIGSAVVAAFLEAGNEVAIICRPTSNTQRLTPLLHQLKVIEGDLKTPNTWEQDLAAWQPDTFVHCAWEGVLGKLRNDPIQLENVATTAETVQIAGRTGCSAWIGLGSQAEYGPANSTIDENFPLRPTTGYGEAKVEAFLRAREACHELGIRFGWLRVFSTYGPGDSLEWMIPSLVEKLLDGERPPLTMGEQLWDYLHVRDAARAVVALASSQDAHGAFNLGSGEAVKLRDLIEGIRDAIDPDLPLGFGEVPYRPDQVMVLHANVDRLKSATGWQPKETLKNGLDELVASRRKERSYAID